MNLIRLLVLTTSISFLTQNSYGQDSLVSALAKKDLTTFSRVNESFTGDGWELLVNLARDSKEVLIGEDHFFNEIPFFVAALSKEVPFDNFFCEIDPYSATIIETNIKERSESDLQLYINEWGETFSFYALEPEFQLLKQLVASNTSLNGLDQILLVSDRLIAHDLKGKTTNAKAKRIYESIEENSKAFFDAFLNEKGETFYMLTETFEDQLDQLLALNLSPSEIEAVEALKMSLKIYKEQNHPLRIQLMKHNLMASYEAWKDQKNLFKFGAVHAAKGESLLKIHDIGNLVHNLADSQFEKSLHLMIVGKSGTQGVPFRGMEEEKYRHRQPKSKIPSTVNGYGHFRSMA